MQTQLLKNPNSTAQTTAEVQADKAADEQYEAWLEHRLGQYGY
jgi:hypothetical protein